MRVRSFPLLLTGLALPLLAGCGTSRVQPAFQPVAYAEAMARTNPLSGTLLEAGSEREAQAVRRFTEFYREYTYDVIKAGVRELYAPEAFFADPFHMHTGIEAIEAYFLSAAEAVKSCTFDIEDVVSADGEYYFRWTMRLVTKRYPDEPIVAIGMSHVRFDAEGRVVFHQDYWDAGGAVYERIPVLGGLIRSVRARL